MKPERSVKVVLMMVWSLVAGLALLVFAPAGFPAHAGGELAMLMSIVSFPGSILVGLLFNAINVGRFLPESGLALFCIWLPYFAAGLAQWYVISVVIAKWRSHDKGKEKTPKRE